MSHKSIMGIGAHADDLELQAGGTLCKYRDYGYDIVYVMTTNNMSGGFQWLNADGTIEKRTPAWDEMMARRKKEAADAATYFGTEPIHLGHPQKHYVDKDGNKRRCDYGTPAPEGVTGEWPSMLMAQEDEASIQRVADLILEHDPEVILTHGGPMANVEHFTTLVLVTHAYWKAVDAGFEGMLLSWHDLGVNIYGEGLKRWDTFVDITDYWDQKIECSAFHACQKPDPARLDWPQWGPACGCGQAEVFNIIGRNRSPKQYGAFTLEILQNES